MKPYNGFTGAERARAGALKRKAVEAGAYTMPRSCEACGQDRGTIHSHNEDYREPLDAYGCCYACHMMIHCRVKNPERWREYVNLLERGAIFRACSSWDVFVERFLERAELNPDSWGPPRLRCWLLALPDVPGDRPPALPEWARSRWYRMPRQLPGQLSMIGDEA